jgi:hypothetical protein
VSEFVTQRLSAWQNFYVIVGSSAAALIGVQFVVIALVAGMRRRIATAESVRAFATPTVVHLGGALLVSALMTAPWSSLVPVSVALAICCLGGLGYGAVVIRHVRRQSVYKPVREDWVWHAVVPCVAYAALGVSAVLLHVAARLAVFSIGAAALALLLIGIHNAWDTVTHVVVTGADDPTPPSSQGS